ncbi:hypothetical protein AZE42_13011, partial [Rhizopogon vesiculosus]
TLDSRIDDANNSEIELISSHSNKRLIKGRNRAGSPDAEDFERDDDEDTPVSKKQPKKHHKKDQHVANADLVDADGFLQDIEVMDINKSSKLRREQRSRDIDALFSAPYLKDGKKYRDCHACSKSHKCAVSFVNEVTTLRRHQEAAHRGDYLKWAKNNDFISMLPKDAKQRREQAAADQQPSISGYLKPRAPNEHVMPYTDELFREAAIKWLIETDQPIDALEHPAFKNMIDIAARTTNGIKLRGLFRLLGSQ